MRYDQSREKSADILRSALKLMGQQLAGFHPASYALWYEHSAQMNPALSAALNARLETKSPLTDADVWRLYAQFVGTEEAQAIEKLRQRLLALLRETGQVVSDTGLHAILFGAALEDRSKQLKQPVTVSLLTEIVGELLSRTDQMSAVNTTLAKQLQASAGEVSTLTQRLEQVQAESIRDPLTGLLNRRGFDQAIADISGGAGALAGATLLLLDIDRFKTVNDSHGHQLGDQVLRTVAQIVHARIKGSDIAMRLGGDEFVVLLPETSISGGLTVAEHVRALLTKSRWSRVGADEHVERITLSVGVAHCSGSEPLAELLQRADAALYRAKREGRDRVVAAEGN